MPSHPRSAWERLGKLLVRRRIELDPRYRNRRTFEAERAPDLYRIINDIELGRRDNYEPGTVAALEAAYELEPGAISRFLDGGELVAASPPSSSPAEPTGAGREDAAAVLAEMQRREADAPLARLQASPRREAAPPASDDPDLRPWRQQVLRLAYEAAGVLPRLGPGELPEPDELPGVEEVLLGLPGALIFDADHEISAWDSDALPLQRKINVIAMTRRLGAKADERERNRRTGLAGYVPVSGGIHVLVSVAGSAAGASS